MVLFLNTTGPAAQTGGETEPFVILRKGFFLVPIIAIRLAGSEQSEGGRWEDGPVRRNDRIAEDALLGRRLLSPCFGY